MLCSEMEAPIVLEDNTRLRKVALDILTKVKLTSPLAARFAQDNTFTRFNLPSQFLNKSCSSLAERRNTQS